MEDMQMGALDYSWFPNARSRLMYAWGMRISGFSFVDGTHCHLWAQVVPHGPKLRNGRISGYMDQLTILKVRCPDSTP